MAETDVNFFTSGIGWTIFIVVLLVCMLTILFFFMTLIKRIKRLKEDRKKKEYLEFIEGILFKYLFEDYPMKDILSIPEYQKLEKNFLFQKVVIKAIIGLHDNYSGIYSKKLEEFYKESGLATYSVRKLESEKWPEIVEGLRDLSTLNYVESYFRIASRITYPHDLVKIEVLLALIKMGGIEEIMKFQKSGLVLNDWVQSNILFTVQKHKIPAPHNLGLMLKSSNRTMVLLAVRLINHYKKAEYYETLSDYLQKTKDKQLEKEITGMLRKTEFV